MKESVARVVGRFTKQLPGTAVAQQSSIAVVNEILCVMKGWKKLPTARQINEAVRNLFNKQALHEAVHLYGDLRGKGRTLRANTPEKMIKTIMERMTEDEGDTGILHFVADNLSCGRLSDY